jgi:hypothetical protein
MAKDYSNEVTTNSIGKELKPTATTENKYLRFKRNKIILRL